MKISKIFATVGATVGALIIVGMCNACSVSGRGGSAQTMDTPKADSLNSNFECSVQPEQSDDRFNPEIASARIFVLTNSSHDVRIRMFNRLGEQKDTAMCLKGRHGKFNCYDRDASTLEFSVPAFNGNGLYLKESEFLMVLAEIRENSGSKGKKIAFLCDKSRD
jgi:hypothetical protein